ncbi:uncharacterized protein LOC134435371 [Engraulis encrasicolus]|uniref:uncharacterized protein LOC134435371 n=1 Tax=Engraulis encrasicolus TaxID=184585 RepID=UPI002FD45711
MEIMEKSERAHFFTAKEQQLLIEGYEIERPILTDKSNTIKASKMREEAWQRIAVKLNLNSGSGYKRTWQQVKIKYKNLLQTANRKKVDLHNKNDMELTLPASELAEQLQLPVGVIVKLDEPDEELVEQQTSCNSRPMLEGIPGGTSSDPEPQEPQDIECASSYISVTGHTLTLLPPPQGDTERLIYEETLSTDTHPDEDIAQEKIHPTGKKTTEGPVTEDIKTLYRRYLVTEIENREQEMAYRALKMRKVEKEIQLLDKQLVSIH